MNNYPACIYIKKNSSLNSWHEYIKHRKTNKGKGKINTTIIIKRKFKRHGKHCIAQSKITFSLLKTNQIISN